MIRNHVTWALAAASMLFTAAVSAQITFDPRIDQRADRESDCQQAVGASRTRARSRQACEPENDAATVTQEHTITIAVELPELPSAQCTATSTTEYQQRNTVARVNTTVAVSDCTAASGELTVAARIRDASGETKAVEFSETWQRSDGQDVKLTGDYPIGEDVDLVNVRIRGLTCTCADSSAAAVADAPPPN